MRSHRGRRAGSKMGPNDASQCFSSSSAAPTAGEGHAAGAEMGGAGGGASGGHGRSVAGAGAPDQQDILRLSRMLTGLPHHHQGNGASPLGTMEA